MQNLRFVFCKFFFLRPTPCFGPNNGKGGEGAEGGGYVDHKTPIMSLVTIFFHQLPQHSSVVEIKVLSASKQNLLISFDHIPFKKHGR